jgi:hypothetical protein
LIDIWNTKYPYLVTTIGVALMAISTMFGLARGMLSPAGGPGDRQFGNMTAGNMTAVVNMNPNGMNPGVMSPGLFGLMDNLVLVAVIIAIVGLVWLGLTIRKSEKMATSQASTDGSPHD